MEDAGRSSVPGRSSCRICAPHLLGVAPGRAHTSSAISSPTGVPDTTATSVPSMRRSSSSACSPARASSAAASVDVQVDDGRDHRPGAGPRALRDRALDEGIGRDRRRVVGGQHGAPRLGRERLRGVAPHVVERHRVDAAARRDRVAHRHPGDRLPARRLPRDGGVLLEQAEGVRGDVPTRPAADLVGGRHEAAERRRLAHGTGREAQDRRLVLLGVDDEGVLAGARVEQAAEPGGGNGEAGRKRARRRRAGAAPARGGPVRGPARSTGPGRPRSGRARGCPQRRARARSAERPRDRPSRGDAGRASPRRGRRRAARGGRGRGSPAPPSPRPRPSRCRRRRDTAGRARRRAPSGPGTARAPLRAAGRRTAPPPSDAPPAPPGSAAAPGSGGRRRRRSARAADGGPSLRGAPRRRGRRPRRRSGRRRPATRRPAGRPRADGPARTRSRLPSRQHAASPQS